MYKLWKRQKSSIRSPDPAMPSTTFLTVNIPSFPSPSDAVLNKTFPQLASFVIYHRLDTRYTSTLSDNWRDLSHASRRTVAGTLSTDGGTVSKSKAIGISDDCLFRSTSPESFPFLFLSAVQTVRRWNRWIHLIHQHELDCSRIFALRELTCVKLCHIWSISLTTSTLIRLSLLLWLPKFVVLYCFRSIVVSFSMLPLPKFVSTSI